VRSVGAEDCGMKGHREKPGAELIAGARGMSGKSHEHASTKRESPAFAQVV
jgi:hypothetical protein